MKFVCIYITIGNSDDKLTQKEWKEFCHNLHNVVFISYGGITIYGPWYTNPVADRHRQSCIIGVEIRTDSVEDLKRRVIELARLYRQDTVAWAECEVQLLQTAV